MSDDKIKKIGTIIKNNRKKQGLTQEQLAAISGVGIRFIRELENGKNSCHIGKAFDVISLLGIEILVDSEKI